MFKNLNFYIYFQTNNFKQIFIILDSGEDEPTSREIWKKVPTRTKDGILEFFCPISKQYTA